ncbi:MAG: CPBP family intramembrane metalloprotease [Bacteroides sp.]|nr:CPBP family intramembrane metalloprotease [Bacteroides sp.]MCM1379680.1 CPBP family intramembrane metalloprotease [Bacteroides sp.]MCM1446035.1 CPBP family intramembrane metalloprotease [Prevotella sp.]
MPKALKYLFLLFLLFVIGIALTGGLSALLVRLTDNSLAVVRITIVCQDLLAFVLPAVITALLITRLPADLLCLRTLPSAKMTGLTIATLLLSLPAIEGLNSLCEMLPWPQSVLDLEAAAEAASTAILGPHTGLNLAIALMIMSILTGLSEELFFRGAMQNILRSGMGAHLAIWLTALIFAAMHGQAVGLLPRTLLGAFFGYVLLWSGSLWLPIICHVVNNALAVLTMWAGIDSVSTPALSVVSAALTAAGVYLMLRQSRSKSSGI